MRRLPFSVLGAAGTAIGCAAMAASLPAAVATALGSIGLGGSSLLARSLGAAARPLFIVSALLLILGALGCSRLVTAFAASGVVLLYLSMFELAGGDGGTMNMNTMARGQAAVRADAPSFYGGLAAVVLALVVQLARRHNQTCKPLLRRRRGS